METSFFQTNSGTRGILKGKLMIFWPSNFEVTSKTFETLFICDGWLVYPFIQRFPKASWNWVPALSMLSYFPFIGWSYSYKKQICKLLYFYLIFIKWYRNDHFELFATSYELWYSEECTSSFLSFVVLASQTCSCNYFWSMVCWLVAFCRFGFKPRRSLEIILFTSEEPTRFGISCLGRFLYSKYILIWLHYVTLVTYELDFPSRYPIL